MSSVISIANLSKTYKGGFKALDGVDLEIERGEIFALLGPNGAGKTTLISIVCGIVTPTSGQVLADGHDIQREYKKARSKIGLVPQEISTDMFEKVIVTVNFSRGLFGKAPDSAYIEQLLKDLSLWDKRDSAIRELSGGMKRRVMIAKALSHEPEILFLDEPTAGVDVELRRDMWRLVSSLRERGVTIILTTHYIEEAEEMADRVGVIRGGEIILVDKTEAIMRKLGKRRLSLTLQEPLESLPAGLGEWSLELADEGHQLLYSFDANEERTGIPTLLRKMTDLGIGFSDLDTAKSSLEDIFVDLVSDNGDGKSAEAAE
ncbi:ABC transporter ATP-binding protein [Parasphingopyxis marina]|uniref:ABC transporter ATP-binding protein n=1 Tax=Parasphingopyxis marina TaxID=2761622 RepID=A0A842I0U8_9SPHN|nr:ABC transporter ATP-binding protein [Parasphingopyxis marina]MBC2778755.1 ABC transporter ATP-binding protein [Parasphingopyxis marina]